MSGHTVAYIDTDGRIGRSPLDIIELPGQPGKYGRRVLVEAWQAAGSPPVNNSGAGRLYSVQKYFWDGWAARLPGFNPADNPDDETQRLAHVRFGALDIDPTPERVRRLAAAGLVRPYSYEPWHWELPNIRQYGIVRALPTAPAPKPAPPIRRPSMIHAAYRTSDGSIIIQDKSEGPLRGVGGPEWRGILAANPGISAAGITNAERDKLSGLYGITWPK